MRDDELQVWQIALDDVGSADCLAVVSRAERERAERFGFPHLRQRHLAAHAALRGVLGRVLGQEPHRIELGLDAHGKPRLAQAGPPLFFNLSHSGERALVALSARGSVGVDIERCRPNPHLIPLVERYFSPSERQAFRALDDEERLVGFYRWWTCKEACLKATGLGLRYPLDGFSVEYRLGRTPRVLEATGPVRGLELQSLELQQPGWCAAAAVASPGPPVVVMRRWSWNWLNN
jgi:4'-phosphopantetheinyl transferase